MRYVAFKRVETHSDIRHVLYACDCGRATEQVIVIASQAA
jgi:hypothetical protein